MLSGWVNNFLSRILAIRFLHSSCCSRCLSLHLSLQYLTSSQVHFLSLTLSTSAMPHEAQTSSACSETSAMPHKTPPAFSSHLLLSSILFVLIVANALKGVASSQQALKLQLRSPLCSSKIPRGGGLHTKVPVDRRFTSKHAPLSFTKRSHSKQAIRQRRRRAKPRGRSRWATAVPVKGQIMLLMGRR